MRKGNARMLDRCLVSFLGLLLLAGCADKAKQAENKPESQASTAQAVPPSGGATAPSTPSAIPLVDSHGNPVPGMPSAAPASTGGGLVWTTPSGWKEETPSSSMRKAQYSLPPAGGDAEPGQCAVFYFGAGQGGDAKANVERWANQFQDASGGHPTPKITEGSVGGIKVMQVETEGTYTPSPMMGGDLTPKPGQMLLGAIVQGPDSNWFFKCTGGKKTMESHRREFQDLIGSVRFQ